MPDVVVVGMNIQDRANADSQKQVFTSSLPIDGCTGNISLKTTYIISVALQYIMKGINESISIFTGKTDDRQCC